MKFNATSPCKNCPYRTDAPLALWDRKEFEQVLELDAQMFGRVFSCHKKDNQVCRGYLMDQDRRDCPNMTLRMVMRKEGVTREYLDALTSPAPLYDSIEQMAEANFPGITADASATLNTIRLPKPRPFQIVADAANTES